MVGPHRSHSLHIHLAPRYGRRILLLISNLLMAVAGTCAAFSTSFPLFCLFRFGCGMALSGLGLNTFSLSKLFCWIEISRCTL